MLFTQMRDMVLREKHPEQGWAYRADGKRWAVICYDERENICYRAWPKTGPGYKRFDTMIPWQESDFLFRPDNTLLINEENITADYMRLRTLAINGGIRRSTSLLTFNRYTHDLRVQYEVVPFMIVSMASGRPLNARRLDQLRIDKTAQKRTNQALAAMHKVVATVVRLAPDRWKDPLNKWSQMKEPITNARMLASVAGSFKDGIIEEGKWVDKAISLSTCFYSYENKDDKEIPVYERRARQFDNMIRFHKALIFRELGVVK